MKYIFVNMGYYIRETCAIVRMNLLSNILSLLSAVLVFFILAMVVSLWNLSSHAAEAIQGEAEISVYFEEDMTEDEVLQLANSIQIIFSDSSSSRKAAHCCVLGLPAGVTQPRNSHMVAASSFLLSFG
jgi:hypothetical protein